MSPPESSVGVLVPSLSPTNLCLIPPESSVGVLANVPPATVLGLPPPIWALSSLGVFAAVPPTNVCSAPPTIPAPQLARRVDHVRPTNVVTCPPWSRSSEMATTAIVSMTSDATDVASKIERPVLGACSVSTLALIVPSLRLILRYVSRRP